MTLAEFNCLICNARELEELPEYGALPRVTSDCKPFASGGRIAVCRTCGAVQKPIDSRWKQEANSIYREYQPYFQSGGIEQAVFDASNGSPNRRSAVLLDRLSEVQTFTSNGSLLDVGCGNGVLLSAFSEKWPHWRLFGHELNDLQTAALSRITGFKTLYTGDLADLPIEFDVIMMIHALEHFTDPLSALKVLRSKLTRDGCLFIEVPNAEDTPFDLLIADHVSHFSRCSLAQLIERAELASVVIASDWVTKELSVVARPTRPTATLPGCTPPEVLGRVQRQIAWLHAVMEGVRQAANEERPFGLFGTSIAAMWLFGQFGDHVDFFVDEDPSRQRSTLIGRPVLAPGDVADGTTVYLPLIPPVARAVAARLAGPGCEFRVPPEI